MNTHKHLTIIVQRLTKIVYYVKSDNISESSFYSVKSELRSKTNMKKLKKKKNHRRRDISSWKH